MKPFKNVPKLLCIGSSKTTLLHGSILLLLIYIAGCRKDFDSVYSSKNNSATVSRPLLQKQPNILFILADDVGYEIPTCNGGQSYSTPNIDFMAQNGKRFTQCHSAPMCSPSRLMLMTGKYNFRNYTAWGVMDLNQRTIGNMLQDAGYATCYTGKWQLDGGDNAIKTFGWDKYSVWLPYLKTPEKLEGSRYKNAKIYQDGGYLPDTESSNKYSDDIFTAYLLHFIDSAKNTGHPFFAFYSMILCHTPFCPTPDDPEYNTWDYSTLTNPDNKFFPSMIKYSDKKIGQIIEYLTATGLLDNTLILYAGDNGTASSIFSYYNGFVVQGGKQTATECGTNVPLIACGKGQIAPGTVSPVLIDFTDFIPTLKEVAHIGTVSGFDTLDGMSFAKSLISNIYSIKPYIYDAWSTVPERQNYFLRWVQNAQYKLYDTLQNNPLSNKFVRIEKAKPDSAPLSDSSLTKAEAILKRQLSKVLNHYN